MSELVKLSLKDKKLLYELDFNARAPVSKLAKKLRLSKQGVDYKINSLIDKKVIQGFYPIINVPKLGYIYCRLCLAFKNLSPESEKEMINFLLKDNRYFWVFTAQGPYELMFAMWADSITSFREAMDAFLEKFGQFVMEKNESITTNVIHYKHNYLVNSNDSSNIEIKETKEKILIDEIDKRILSELCTDARQSLVKISQKTNLTTKQVSYRIKKMERTKLIEGYRPLINHKILGYTYYKLWLSIDYSNLESVRKLKTYIKNNPLVIYVVEGISFPEDLDIEIMVKDNSELFSFIKDLKYSFPGVVGKFISFMFQDTKKVRYLPW